MLDLISTRPPDLASVVPLRTGPADFEARFDADWKAARAPDRAWYYEKEQVALWDEALAMLREATGETLPNPYRVTPPPGFKRRHWNPALAETDREAYERYKAETLRKTTDRILAVRELYPHLPDPREFDARIAREATYRRQRAAEIETSSVSLGGLGAFLGGAAGELSHPVQLGAMVMTAPLGAAATGARFTLGAALGSILREAAVQGGIALGTEAAIVYGLDQPLQLRLGTWDPDRAILQVFMAGAGGALLGGGLRALGEGVRALRSRGVRPGPGETDALLVMDTALHDTASNPLGPGGLATHQKLLLEARAAAQEGRAADPNTVLAEQEAPRAARAQARRELEALRADPSTAPPAAREVLAARDTPTRPGSPSRHAVDTAQAFPDGAPAAVYTAAGRRVGVRYEVTELGTLIPSHTDDLAPNGLYPRELQPRDRSRAASETQISEIAAKLEPERLGTSTDAAAGAPIVAGDNVVESGNARVLALRRAYGRQSPRAAAYREWLEAQGYDVAGYKEPVLVARRETPLSDAERMIFVREANEAPTLRMGTAEQAMADAAALTRVVALYRGGDVSSRKNQQFVRAFLKSIAPSERAALVDEDGALSRAGVRRVEAAMLAAAYGDPAFVARLTEATDPGMKSIGNALLDVAGRWAGMRARAAAGEIAPAMDQTANLMAAVRFVAESRAAGQTVADRIAQMDMLAPPTPETIAFMALFHGNGIGSRWASRTTIAERMGAYIEQANLTRPGTDLLGDAAPPPKAIVETVLDRQRGLVRRMESEANDAPKPAAVADARVDEARALATTQEILVPDGEGVMRSAKEVMAAADEKVKSAEALAICAAEAAI